MRPAEAMSRPLSCVLTSRRTLGTQCPRSGSLTPGDDVTWPALVAGGAVSIGDFGCQACGDMSMSGGGIQRCPSTIGDVTTVGPRHVRVPHCDPMSISPPRCHNLASGRRTPPRRGRCTPVSPALDVAAFPVSGRRTGYDTGVRYGAWDATPVFARRPPEPRPGSDLRRGRRVAAPRGTGCGGARPGLPGW